MSYGSGAHGGGHRSTTHGLMEKENDEHISALSDQVSRLKELSISIGEEVEGHNELLGGMKDQFGGAGEMLENVMAKIGVMTQTGGGRHMCALVGFIVVLFVMLWWLMTSGR